MSEWGSMMKLFSFLGDRYHDKRSFFDVLSEALKKHFGSFQIEEGQNLEEADSIVIARWGLSEAGDRWLNEELVGFLSHWLNDGGRLFVWHSGLARYSSSYAELVGGRFIFHPERTSVRYFTEDGFSFEVFDEHYFVELRGKVEIFLWSESIFGRSTAGWKKHLGNGKILALTLAHDEEGLRNEKFRQLLERSLSWLLC